MSSRNTQEKVTPDHIFRRVNGIGRTFSRMNFIHQFIHTLDTVPRNWYTETELRKGTTTWPLMIDSFLLTFAFESEYPGVDQDLQVIKSKIFEDYTISVPA